MRVFVVYHDENGHVSKSAAQDVHKRQWVCNNKEKEAGAQEAGESG